MCPVTTPPGGRPLTLKERAVRDVCAATFPAMYGLERAISELADEQAFLLPGQAAEGMAIGLGRLESGQPDLHPEAIEAKHGRWTKSLWSHGEHPPAATAVELLRVLDDAEGPLLRLVELANVAKRLLDARHDLRAIADEDARVLVDLSVDLYTRNQGGFRRAHGAQR